MSLKIHLPPSDKVVELNKKIIACQLHLVKDGLSSKCFCGQHVEHPVVDYTGKQIGTTHRNYDLDLLPVTKCGMISGAAKHKFIGRILDSSDINYDEIKGEKCKKCFGIKYNKTFATYKQSQYLNLLMSGKPRDMLVSLGLTNKEIKGDFSNTTLKRASNLITRMRDIFR